jgi:heterodisulfide reductase subunit D
MSDPVSPKEGTFFEGLITEATICAYCGYCRTVCPTYAGVGWESCSPRGRIQLTRLLLEGTPLTPEQMTRLYQCTMCGHCTQVCSTRIDLREFWLAARAQTVERNLSPQGLSATRENVVKTGNVYAYQNDERAGWAEYMDDAPADLYQRQQAEVVYFVGCSSSFSPRVQRIAESFVRLMTAADVNFTILGEGEVCCGFPLKVAGMQDQVATLVERNVERVRATGATTVVFTCPACRMMWREEYTRHLNGVRLLHSTELLAELTAAGRLPLRDVKQVVTYHDPCDLARNGGVYDAPRQVLAAIPGLQLVEVHERRERGLCCGGGGDLEMVDPALAQRVAARTVGKLVATGAQAIVTACPQCVRTLTRGAEQSAPDVQVLDLVELCAGALEA